MSTKKLNQDLNEILARCEEGMQDLKTLIQPQLEESGKILNIGFPGPKPRRSDRRGGRISTERSGQPGLENGNRCYHAANRRGAPGDGDFMEAGEG